MILFFGDIEFSLLHVSISFFSNNNNPDFQGYKVIELGYLIIMYLFYPLLHTQQSWNDRANTLISMLP